MPRRWRRGFGVDPGAWSEIRFTDPTNQSLATGTHTKSAAGNTITITVTPAGTVDFTSLKPIEAVYVNKGNGPASANAIYRYVPPVLRDTDLGLRPVTLSGVDHVVLWWATSSPTTTTTTTTTRRRPPAPRFQPRHRRPLKCCQRRARRRSWAGSPTTTAMPILPATGTDVPDTVNVGLVLVLAGLVVLLVYRAARPH